MLKKLAIVFALVAAAQAAHAAPIDLSDWSRLNIDLPGGQGGGNWVLETGNTSVRQVNNADPSLFLNNLNQTSYSIDGQWQVLTASDDDYMGFVFGYQNSSNFYMFDWKQISQNANSALAAEGMTIKKYEGATGNALIDLSLQEFWANTVNVGDITVLATNHSSTAGWADNVLYDFHLDLNVNPGEIHVVIAQGSTTLWDVTVNDSTFTSGQFGFYNFSQEQVRYAGFEQTGGTIVPEPWTLPLFGIVLAGLGVVRRRRAG